MTQPRWLIFQLPTQMCFETSYEAAKIPKAVLEEALLSYSSGWLSSLESLGPLSHCPLVPMPVTSRSPLFVHTCSLQTHTWYVYRVYVVLPCGTSLRPLPLHIFLAFLELFLILQPQHTSLGGLTTSVCLLVLGSCRSCSRVHLASHSFSGRCCTFLLLWNSRRVSPFIF